MKQYFFLFALSVLLSPEAAQAGLFGSYEIPKRNIGRFKKWTDMLSRAAIQKNQPIARFGACNNNGQYCIRPKYHDVINRVRHLDRYNQIREVNRILNGFRYITDREQWGLSDFWETNWEFHKSSGDCEDYAIAKYKVLKALGFRPETMRIVIVQDQNINTAHAILSIRWNGQNLILDNQIKQVLPDTAIYHYQPYYSINERTWWRHS